MNRSLNGIRRMAGACFVITLGLVATGIAISQDVPDTPALDPAVPSLNVAPDDVPPTVSTPEAIDPNLSNPVLPSSTAQPVLTTPGAGNPYTQPTPAPGGIQAIPTDQQGGSEFQLLQPYQTNPGVTQPVAPPSNQPLPGTQAPQQYRVVPQQQYHAVPQQRRYQQPQYPQADPVPATELKVYYLKFAQAETCANLLRDLFQRPEVTITYDARINAVIVRAPANEQDRTILNEIEAVVEQLDKDVPAPRDFNSMPAGAPGLNEAVDPRLDLPPATPAPSSRAAREAEARANHLAEQLRSPLQQPIPNSQLDQQRKQLRKAVAEAFDARQRMQQAQVNLLRQRLARVERQVNARESLKDRIIERRTEELLDPNLNWDSELAPRPASSVPAVQTPGIPLGIPGPPNLPLNPALDRPESPIWVPQTADPLVGPTWTNNAEVSPTPSTAKIVVPLTFVLFAAEEELIDELQISGSDSNVSVFADKVDSLDQLQIRIKNTRSKILAMPSVLTTVGTGAQIELSKSFRIHCTPESIDGNAVKTRLFLSRRSSDGIDDGEINKLTIDLPTGGNPLLFGPIEQVGTAWYVAIARQAPNTTIYRPQSTEPAVSQPAPFAANSNRNQGLAIRLPTTFIETVRSIEEAITRFNRAPAARTESQRKRLDEMRDRYYSLLDATRLEYHTMIGLLKSQLTAALAEVESSENAIARLDQLRIAGAISTEEVLRARTALANAQARVEQFQSMLELYFTSEAAIFGNIVENDLSRMEGQWKVVRHTTSGELAKTTGWQAVIMGNQMQLTRETNSPASTFVLRIVPSKRQFDIVGAPNAASPTPLRGLYRLEQDRLRFVVGEQRPSGFGDTDRSGIDFWELERIDPNDDGGDANENSANDLESEKGAFAVPDDAADEGGTQ